MQVLVNNRVVNYMMTGKGPMAVLLHGWADSSVTFTALTTHLKSNYTVVALDLAGFGNSQPPNSAWGLQEYAESVANTLTKLDIKNVHLLIGHSNGGAIAMYAVAHQLVQPKKLVLLASSGIRTDGSARKQLLKVTAKVGKLGLVILPKSKQKRLREKFYTSIGSDLLAAPHLQETFKRIVSQDIQPEAKRINVPVLLIYGSLDTQTPQHYGQMLANNIKHGQLKLIDGATHFVHQEQPEKVAHLIKDFDK